MKDIGRSGRDTGNIRQGFVDRASNENYVDDDDEDYDSDGDSIPATAIKPGWGAMTFLRIVITLYPLVGA